jgi:hypothetical protein
MMVQPANATPLPFPGIDIATFEAGDINAEEFSHEAHLFVAWSYLQCSDLQTGTLRFTTALRRLVTKLGVPGKYHATITLFFMITIAERMHLNSRDDWTEFREKNTDLFKGAKTFLASYYTKERLDSDLARKQFLLPDRIPIA